MSMPSAAVICFLNKVAVALTPAERRRFNLRAELDELWDAADLDGRALEACDTLTLLAAAGSEFPALFAKAVRAFDLLDQIRSPERP
jgi:hypothetical protein